MEFIATTISEHIFHQGLLEGEARGEAKGEAKGKAQGEAQGEAKGKAEGEVNGQIKMLDMFHQLGLISDEQYQLMMHPLRQKLAELADSDRL